jgi:hypothetical protein
MGIFNRKKKIEGKIELATFLYEGECNWEDNPYYFVDEDKRVVVINSKSLAELEKSSTAKYQRIINEIISHSDRFSKPQENKSSTDKLLEEILNELVDIKYEIQELENQKAYVVESEIKEAQKRDSTIQRRSEI